MICRLGNPFFSSIYAISHNGMLHGGKVHANLVGSPGLNAHFQQRASVESLNDPPFRQRRPSLPGMNGHFLSVRSMPADLQRDASAIASHMPAD
jgi:hypothetical protein